MKLSITSAVLAVGLTLPALAHAQYGYGATQSMEQMSPTPRSFSSDEDRYGREIKKIHDDGMKMVRADGGKLSDTH